MKKVAIVILNFKVAEETIECVRSVLNSSYQRAVTSGYKNLEIIVVDNNSEDGLEILIKEFPNVIFIQNNQNLGYTGGNNIGIKKALEKKADYIFILNPDTTIDAKAIENLVRVVERESAAILGPKILFGDQKTIWYAGGIIDLDNILGVHRGLDEKDHGQYETIEKTEFASGAAMFVKAEVFSKIGFFDDEYFLYLEDLEFCFRANQKGIKIIYVPQAIVYHKNARSTGLGSPLQDYYITRNRLIFAFKYLSWRKRVTLLKHLLETSHFATRRQASLDFLIGNLGKGSFSQ